MYKLPLQIVLRRDLVKLFNDMSGVRLDLLQSPVDIVGADRSAGRNRAVNCRADLEFVPEGIL